MQRLRREREHCRVNKNIPAACGKDAAGPALVGKPEWDAGGVGGWELSEEFLPTPRGKKITKNLEKACAEPHVGNVCPGNELLVLVFLGVRWNVPGNRTGPRTKGYSGWERDWDGEREGKVP